MDTPAVGAATRPVGRYLVASVFLILLIGSLAHSLPTTVRSLVHLGQGDARLTARDRTQIWASGIEITPAQLALVRRALRPGDRFYVETPRHSTISDLHGRISEAAGFALLPNVMVPKARQATVVLAFESDPARLGLRYATIRRHGTITIARVARGR